MDSSRNRTSESDENNEVDETSVAVLGHVTGDRANDMQTEIEEVAHEQATNSKESAKHTLEKDPYLVEGRQENRNN